jgi:hypothetical protein
MFRETEEALSRPPQWNRVVAEEGSGAVVAPLAVVRRMVRLQSRGEWLPSSMVSSCLSCGLRVTTSGPDLPARRHIALIEGVLATSEASRSSVTKDEAAVQ